MRFCDPLLQHKFERTVQRLQAASDPQAMVMSSFRTALMALLSTGELRDSEQLEAALMQLYTGAVGKEKARDVVTVRMEWAKQYGWLPWETENN